MAHSGQTRKRRDDAPTAARRDLHALALFLVDLYHADHTLAARLSDKGVLRPEMMDGQRRDAFENERLESQAEALEEIGFSPQLGQRAVSNDYGQLNAYP